MSRKVHVGKRRSETRVAVVVERDRAYGRELCCGIADAALREDGWALEFVDADSLERSKALRGFDGVIARVAEVVARSGFASAQYFCRVFKADTGLTAESWRGQNNARR